MLLEWSVFAIADREAIFDYVAADSPRAAVTIDDRIESCVEGLANFPEMGRPGRIPETHELVINGTPYTAAYQVYGETVHILRVLHGAQQWPDQMPEEL